VPAADHDDVVEMPHVFKAVMIGNGLSRITVIARSLDAGLPSIAVSLSAVDNLTNAVMFVLVGLSRPAALE
jgi:hypothetical protein